MTTVEGCKQFRQRQMTGKVSLWSPQREAGRTQRHFYAVKSFKSPGSRTRALSHPPKRRVALESFPPSPGPAGTLQGAGPRARPHSCLGQGSWSKTMALTPKYTTAVRGFHPESSTLFLLFSLVSRISNLGEHMAHFQTVVH